MNITTNINRLNTSKKMIRMEITGKSCYVFFIRGTTKISRWRNIQSERFKRYQAHSKQNKVWIARLKEDEVCKV